MKSARDIAPYCKAAVLYYAVAEYYKHADLYYAARRDIMDPASYIMPWISGIL